MTVYHKQIALIGRKKSFTCLKMKTTQDKQNDFKCELRRLQAFTPATLNDIA